MGPDPPPCRTHPTLSPALGAHGGTVPSDGCCALGAAVPPLCRTAAGTTEVNGARHGSGKLETLLGATFAARETCRVKNRSNPQGCEESAGLLRSLVAPSPAPQLNPVVPWLLQLLAPGAQGAQDGGCTGELLLPW